MILKDKNVVVTSGSRGLGLGLVEALVAHGARVTVVARDADALESVRARLGVATISADVTHETAAHCILAEIRPDILALQGVTTSGLISEDDRALWTYKIEDPRLFPRQQDAEYTLAALCELLRNCFSSNWRLLKMHFEHALPSDLASLNRIFRIPIRFSQSGNRIVMERSDVDRACYPRQACHHLARFTPRLSRAPLIIRCACMALKSWAARTVADWTVGAGQELVGKA